MSDVLDINLANLHPGNFIGAGPLPLGHIPSQGGGITVIEAVLAGNGAGTAIGLQLVTLTDVATGGTPAVNGTIGAFAGTIITAAGVVHKATISTAYVAGGSNIGVAQTSGTVPAGTEVSLAYVMGK